MLPGSRNATLMDGSRRVIFLPRVMAQLSSDAPAHVATASNLPSSRPTPAPTRQNGQSIISMQKHIYFSDLEHSKAAISRKKTHQGRRGGGGKQAQPEAGARRRFAQAPTAMPTNPWPKAEPGPAPGRPPRPPTARRGGATLAQLSSSDELAAPN